ncbi:MAG: heavy metal translocating P-type ATPase [Lachnospiraceae bacterium]|nr:heavy metal translocating P-type ATPase [Lachnospiraceae bacterium]
MSKKLKKQLKRIGISGALFAAGMILEHLPVLLHLTASVDGFGAKEILELSAVPFFIVSYLLIGLDVVKAALSGVRRKQMMDENFLMTIATFGAFLLGDLGEACAVMLFYQVGEWFQSYAVGKSRKSIKDLMDICPEYANVKRGDSMEEVDPDEVQIGEIIVIKPGERVPLDGIVKSGFSSLDTKAISGESMPRDIKPGDSIVSGCVNMSAMLEVEVTKVYENSTVAKILDLVENASANKAEAEQFISKFARVYTPIVVYSAMALALVPPIFITIGNLAGLFGASLSAGWGDWIYRGLVFLVTSCPCALVISIPLSFFGGIGGAGKEGILIKGSNYLEALAKVDTVVMDKTGTLTKGTFSLQELHAVNISAEDFLRTLAHVEFLSNHPIAKSVVAAYAGEIDENTIENMKEIPGKGIQVDVEGATYFGGNYRLMEDLGFVDLAENKLGTIVHLAKGNDYLGYAVVADSLKEDTKEAMRGLKACGVTNLIMLTGDKKETAESVAAEIGIDTVYAELLPSDKVDKFEALYTSKNKSGQNKGKLCFVGDGMNDAPVLARADIGIAMGGMGSDAAIEAADIVIMTDEPSKITRAMQISRKTLGIVRQNIVGAIGIKVIVLVLTAIGLVGMWAAVFADVGVAFIAILNAMRALKTKK